MTTISPTTSAITRATNMPSPVEARLRGLASASTSSQDKLHKAFTDFVGQTFFGQMIKAMRSTVDKAAYFDGGQAEEIFRGQLDQTIAKQLSDATAERFADPMFERQFPGVSASRPESDTAGFDQLSRLSRR
jgi:flagellar protein FlgJ